MKVVKYYEKTYMPWGKTGERFIEHTPNCDDKIMSNKIYTSDILDDKSGENIRWWITTKEFYHILRPIITEFEYTFNKSPFGEPFRYVMCGCLELRIGIYEKEYEYVQCKWFFAHTKQEALKKFYGLQTTDDLKALRCNWAEHNRWTDEFEEKCKTLNSILCCVDEYKSLAAELSQSPAPLLSELVRDSESHTEYIEKIEKLKSYEKALDILGIKHESYQCRI